MTATLDTRSLAQMQADVAGWHDDMAARRQALRDKQTARMARTNVVRDGDLAGVPLAVVSPVSEPVETRETVEVETMPQGGTLPRGYLYLIRDARDAADAAYRRRVMAEARRRETMRRAALVETTETVETLADPETYTVPDASEWHGVPLRTLSALASEGWQACSEILNTLETVYAARQARVRGIVATMAVEPDRDGRGTYYAPRASWGVNATETRHSERWHGTPVETLDGDYGCYRIVPPASGIGPAARVPFVPPTVEVEGSRSRRKVETVPADDAATRLRAIVAHLTAGTD